MAENTFTHKHITKGYAFTIIAALLWGIAGTIAQYLFQTRHLEPGWLVSFRSLVSGIIFLIWANAEKKNNIWCIWKDKKDALQMFLFGIFGMLGVQYTYFVAIEASNAATATVLQYLGPAIIVVYLSLLNRKMPLIKEIAAIALALIGTFLLVTHGSINTLSISRTALFWGISSAFALAIYTIQPIELLNKWDAKIVIGWGMIITAIILSFVHSPFHIRGIWDWKTFLFTAFIVIFGSIIAFYLYLVSVRVIGPSKASLLACTEPVSAAFFSVVWLKVDMKIFDWAGAFLILFAVFLLTVMGKNKSLDEMPD